MTLKRLILMVVLAAVTVVVVTYAIRLVEPSVRAPAVPGTATLRADPAAARREIAMIDSAVVIAIRARDFSALAELTHPSKGVRVTHYTYVRPDSDVVLRRDDLRRASDGTVEHLWGAADGTGDPVRMTVGRYFARHLEKDFTNAPRVGYNSGPIGTGNTLNNIAQVYPEAIIVERHFPGVDPRYGGMDWRSLWLAYERHDGVWYLVGIARGVWTI